MTQIEIKTLKVDDTFYVDSKINQTSVVWKVISIFENGDYLIAWESDDTKKARVVPETKIFV